MPAALTEKLKRDGLQHGQTAAVIGTEIAPPAVAVTVCVAATTPLSSIEIVTFPAAVGVKPTTAVIAAGLAG